MGDIATPEDAQRTLRAMQDQELLDLYTAMRAAATILNTVPAGNSAVIDDAFEVLRSAYWSRTPEPAGGALFPTRWRASDPATLSLFTTE